MSILFINSSPNKNGNTAKLAEMLMNGKAYQTLNLVDYKVYGYGQNFADDQFTEIVEQMKAADTIVIGSPVYWHNMSGMVRNLIDRFYGPVFFGCPLRGDPIFRRLHRRNKAQAGHKQGEDQETCQ